MKKLKYLFVELLCLLSLGLFSCRSDNCNDNNDTPKTKTYTYDDGSKNVYEFTYDDDGNITMMVDNYYESDGNLSSSKVFIYEDGKGTQYNLKYTTYYNEDGSGTKNFHDGVVSIKIEENEYDENWNITKENIFYYDGNKILNEKYTKEYEYDKQGYKSKTIEINYDSNNLITSKVVTNNLTGSNRVGSIETYFYINGNIVAMEKQDSDWGNYYIKYIYYDGDNNEITKEEFNTLAISYIELENNTFDFVECVENIYSMTNEYNGGSITFKENNVIELILSSTEYTNDFNGRGSELFLKVKLTGTYEMTNCGFTCDLSVDGYYYDDSYIEFEEYEKIYYVKETISALILFDKISLEYEYNDILIFK